jgi:molybdopterin molybdotransferase
MKTIGEALREIVPCFEPVGSERVALLQAVGRTLAEDVRARTDLPRFDNSAMDGYAARHQDLVPEGRLPLQGESRAGGSPPSPLHEGAAMRIFTGAPMPAGANTVVIQEHATAEAETVRVHKVPARGANVRARASDLARGSLALASGQRIGPGEIGLLAAQGLHSVTVYRRPRVAILSTGDELREIGDDDAPGTIVNSNAYALSAQVLEAGAEPWVLPPAADRLEDIADKLSQALRADVVLSIGGVSVGQYDLVAPAFARAGIETKLWKVAIKPGKPLLFGMAGRVPVLGLPGNPVSAMVTFEMFVRPGLRRMQGSRTPYPALIEVELEHEHRHATGRTELARAVLRRDAAGPPLAQLHSHQGSGSLPSMCGVDALVVLDGATERFARGQKLLALPLRVDGGLSEPPLP